MLISGATLALGRSMKLVMWTYEDAARIPEPDGLSIIELAGALLLNNFV
ncbi:hypothetical protein [Spirosoma utsteinense]|uniref:Uncharacterized protein n=1 Tax=Spirosoma utsteinense TaxID=2585773 RepID=A0ABR6W8S5_9BACT|nr:hypothetical protein [Spirosoma utsteinense]MBC3792205.1 hypothetical protein [Spirosoma utsteinense]